MCVCVWVGGVRACVCECMRACVRVCVHNVCIVSIQFPLLLSLLSHYE